jgi:hypothetical protein
LNQLQPLLAIRATGQGSRKQIRFLGHLGILLREPTKVFGLTHSSSNQQADDATDQGQEQQSPWNSLKTHPSTNVSCLYEIIAV